MERKLTRAINIIPKTNAPILYMFVLNLSLNIENFPRQLNPWNKRAIVNVSKANVVANILFVLNPTEYDANVANAINPP